MTGDRRVWTRRALLLIGVTAAYNLAEAGVALWAGVRADSIALVGFGLDSVIELVAALVVFGRMWVEAAGGSAERVAGLEHRVRRVVGWTFVLLAAYVTLQAGWVLWYREVPEESLVGIVLAALSLAVMPLVAWGKVRAAHALGSRALLAEAKETLACAYLSACLLVGLLANATLGWWWADPVAALAMVPWLVHEGREALEDEDDACH